MSAAESWFSPASVAEPRPARQRTTRRTPASARPKAQKRSFRVRLPLVWMVVFAVLLVGVVALNAAVLRANVAVNNLDKQIAQHQQQIANLASDYSSATAAPRVEAGARRDGLVPAATLTLIDMGGTK